MGNGQIKVWNYDYSQLDASTRQVVEQKTTEIRDRMGRAAQNIVEIGQRLIDVKAKLPHGEFGEWLRDEFAWSERTAQNMMNVAIMFKSANFADLSIAPSALYLLASDDTPKPVREQFIERAKSGEPVTHAAVKQAVTAAKPQAVRVVASEIGEDEDTKQGVIPQKGHDVEEIYERSIETAFEKARERESKAPAISPKALSPIRGHSDPEPILSFNLPKDPSKAAASLLQAMGMEYLSSLVEAANELLSARQGEAR